MNTVVFSCKLCDSHRTSGRNSPIICVKIDARLALLLNRTIRSHQELELFYFTWNIGGVEVIAFIMVVKCPDLSTFKRLWHLKAVVFILMLMTLLILPASAEMDMSSFEVHPGLCSVLSTLTSLWNKDLHFYSWSKCCFIILNPTSQKWQDKQILWRRRPPAQLLCLECFVL